MNPVKMMDGNVPKVGVIGLGFVGGALKQSFEKRGCPITAYDKYKKIGSLEEMYDCDYIFLCLPTPYIENHGYNIGAHHEVLQKISQLHQIGFQGLVVNKSTVEPGTTKLLSETYHINMANNPEFLTARTAFEDFDNQKHIVIGYHELISKTNLHGYSTPKYPILYLSNFYQSLYPDATISICTAEESESMKLFCNVMYATKIQLLTEYYLLCQRTGANFEKVKEMMLLNGWINPMHTQIPGPDGQISFGGECFPKDINALKHFMKRVGTPMKLLEAVIDERNGMREYKYK